MKFLVMLFLIASPLFSLASTNVQISLSPERSYILPGATANCLDLANYKIALSKSNKAVLQASVPAARVSFPEFSLNWDAQADLSVTFVRVSIQSAALEGGKFSYDIYGSELEALVGGRVATNFLKVGQMNSNDSARDCDPLTKTNVFSGVACHPTAGAYTPRFAACGLDVGGIEFATSAPKSFTAPLLVELYGFMKDSNGEFQSVYSTAHVTVQYENAQ